VRSRNSQKSAGRNGDLRKSSDFVRLADALAETARGFYSRGWIFGTSGNFSSVISRDPLHLAITASGLDKGRLSRDGIVVIDGDGESLDGMPRASAEAALHIAIVRNRNAGAVLHTHSVWSTLLSDRHGDAGGFAIEGYEMLKGLNGISTHDHAEWIPIIENSQDCDALAKTLDAVLTELPNTHAFLLRRHGLYTWGNDLDEARRHIEILEFLMEVTGRTATAPALARGTVAFGT
jgi:methylthioribulose-1-phosphate dehydratase